MADERSPVPSASPYRLVIAPDLGQLPYARCLMQQVGEVAGLSEDRAFDLQVVVSEACANAIEHAASEVEIVAYVVPDRVIVEITNDGVFQPGLYKDDASHRRGLGLPLMVSLADQVHVARLPGDRTQVSLTFFLDDRRSDGNVALPVGGAASHKSPDNWQAPEPRKAVGCETLPLERALRESEDRYQSLVDLSPDGILVHADGYYVFANPAAARFFGARSPDEIVGRHVMELVHPDDREFAISRMDLEYAGAVTPPRPSKFLRVDGSLFEAEVIGTKIDFGGRRAIQLVLRDTTERRRAEEDLRESRERLDLFAGIVENASQPVGVGFTDGRLGVFNRAYAELLGYSQEEFRSLDWSRDLTPPEWRELEAAQLAELERTGRPVTYEKEYVRKDRTRVPVELLVNLARDADGTPLYYYSFITDLTERNRAEEALRESERRVRHKLDSLLSPVGDIGELELADIIDSAALQSFLEDFHQLAGIPLAIIDLEGKVLVGAGWSDICTKFHRVHPDTCMNCVESDTLLTTGVPEGEFRLYKCKNHMWDVATPIIVGGKHVGNVFSGQFFFEDEPIDRDLFRSQARKYGFEEEAYIEALDSVPLLSQQALERGMGFFMKLARMLSKESYGSINLVRSLTERDGLLASLRESEERFRLMFERHNAVMLLIDPETGAIEDGNVAASRFYGCSRDELRALSIQDLNQLPAEELGAEYRKAAVEERNHFVFPHLAAGGEIRWVDVHSAPIEVQGKELLFSIIHDVTERNRAEAALRQSEATFRATLDAATESIWLFSADGVILAGNAVAIDRMGKPAEEVVGKHFVEILPPELAKARLERLEHVVESGLSLEFEDERAGSIFLHSFCPVSDDTGRVHCVASFSRDITERKRAEEALSKLNRTLRALSESNQALVRSTDESRYVEEVCRIIVEDCGYAMVWIGYAEDDEGKSVRPVASAGFEEGYLESLRITWSDSERGRGPTGTAIRTGKVCACRNMLTDPDFSPWRVEAIKRGYASSITVPLMADESAFGALMIYSTQPDGFAEDEVDLLRDLADDLARGITTLRLRALHAEAEKEKERLIEQLQEASEELAASNEELQSQAEELAAQSEELEVQNDELILIQERLEDSNHLSQALNQVNESLNSTLEFSEVLRRVVREGASVLNAEKAVLELREEDGWLVQEVLGLPEELRGLRLSDEEASVASAMYRRREMLVIEDSMDDPRVNRSTIWRYGTSAALVVPVSLRSQILGSLHFIWTGGPRTFAKSEVDFARKLTTSLAFALDNAQLHQQQKVIAQKLQQTLLDIPEQVDGVRFGHLYRSATEEASVGGDFYEVFGAKNGRIALLIGDVCGHGVEAARVATLVKDVVHAFAHEFPEPSVVLAKTNELLLEKRTPGFVTLLLGALDPVTGLFTYSSAGHPSALLRLKGGEVAVLEAGSAPLGVFADYSWRESEVRLQQEDLLFLYTDGAIEARQGGEFFGQEGLVAALKRWSEPTPESLPAAILDEVMTFSGGVLTDDVALLALSLTEVAGETDATKLGLPEKVAG